MSESDEHNNKCNRAPRQAVISFLQSRTGICRHIDKYWENGFVLRFKNLSMKLRLQDSGMFLQLGSIKETYLTNDGIYWFFFLIITMLPRRRNILHKKQSCNWWFLILLDTQRQSSSFTCKQSCLFWVFLFSPPTAMSGSLGGTTDMCLDQWILADMSSFTQHLTAKKQSDRELKKPRLFQQRPMEMGEQGEIRRKGLNTPQNADAEFAVLDSHPEVFLQQIFALIAQSEHLKDSDPLPPQTGRSRVCQDLVFVVLKWPALRFSVQGEAASHQLFLEIPQW